MAWGKKEGEEKRTVVDQKKKKRLKRLDTYNICIFFGSEFEHNSMKKTFFKTITE